MENYKIGHWYHIFSENVLITGYQVCHSKIQGECDGCKGYALFDSINYENDSCCGKSGGKLMYNEIYMQLTNERW